MPQIWMTYEELADLLSCTVSDVRQRIQREGLDRKLSRDGKKRVKLSPPMIAVFLDLIRNFDVATDGAVSELWQIHALLANDREATQRAIAVSP